MQPPTVSIIIPCYNEARTIHSVLEAVYDQTYPRERMEVVLSDGRSTDGTREAAARFQQEHPDLKVRLLENDTRTIPSGLNLALRHAVGEIIVRLDAHSLPIREYVERCVAAHQAGRGENIGGVWEIRPGAATRIAEAIAAAAAHPLGAGDALYRLKASAGPVDTVPFGSFRAELIRRIGPFDETLLTNEDYEFNARVRASGGTVFLDPAIRSVYFARGSLGALARQYWRYGYWKWRMLVRHPGTLRWRQALPPLFTAGLIVLSVLSLWAVWARVLLSVQVLTYLTVLEAAGLTLAFERKQIHMLISFPPAVAVMHLSWGMGFLWSVIAGPFVKHG